MNLKPQNRLIDKIAQERKKGKKLFCAFLTLGFPNLAATARLIREFEKAGVDVIELGFPFSDPLADGPTIQYASEQALKKGVRMRDAFNLIRVLRKRGLKVPVLFFGYLNPILRHGFSAFARDARNAGFDGLIVPDLPPGEEPELEAACRRAGLAQVFLAAPTTSLERARRIARVSTGFLYYVSVRGVTGARRALAVDIRGNIRMLKRFSRNPVLIGFGVSTPKQARDLCATGDGVIVGSAIVEKIRQAGGRIDQAARFVRGMVRAVKRV